MDFALQIERLVPGTTTSKTQRTRVLTVEFPDRSQRCFTNQQEALAYVREYARAGGHPTAPDVTDPYLLSLVEWAKDQL